MTQLNTSLCKSLLPLALRVIEKERVCWSMKLKRMGQSLAVREENSVGKLAVEANQVFE